MLRRRVVGSVGAAALVGATVLSMSAGPAYAGIDPGPGNGDARIRKGNGDYLGKGVYNSTGENQEVFKSLVPGQRYTADVRVKNDGNGPTGITMEGDVDSNAEQNFKVKFLKQNGKDVTEKVENRELVYKDVAEGASTPRLEIVVKARDTANDGDSVTVSVWGILGDNPPSSGDTVIAHGALPQ
jgi:hypothetical protein